MQKKRAIIKGQFERLLKANSLTIRIVPGKLNPKDEAWTMEVYYKKEIEKGV